MRINFLLKINLVIFLTLFGAFENANSMERDDAGWRIVSRGRSVSAPVKFDEPLLPEIKATSADPYIFACQSKAREFQRGIRTLSSLKDALIAEWSTHTSGYVNYANSLRHMSTDLESLPIKAALHIYDTILGKGVRTISPRQKFLCHLGIAKIYTRFFDSLDLADERKREALTFAHVQTLLAAREEVEDSSFPGFLRMLEEKRSSLPSSCSEITVADYVLPAIAKKQQKPKGVPAA